MRIVSIIQARMGSTRLPGKVLLKLGGKTVLEQVTDRSNAVKRVSQTVIATTVNRLDLAIVRVCATKGISVYCGSENDVLDRYYQTARLFGADHIVRITSDCPVIDPRIVDQVIDLHLKKKSDLTANVLTETFPDGLDVEVFTLKSLFMAWRDARLLSQREHVTPYIKDHPRLFRLVNVPCSENLYHKRWTLDNSEDYEFLRRVYHALYKKNTCFGMKEILAYVQQHPETERINQHIVRNEGYMKSLRHDQVVE